METNGLDRERLGILVVDEGNIRSVLSSSQLDPSIFPAQPEVLKLIAVKDVRLGIAADDDAASVDGVLCVPIRSYQQLIAIR